jgi:hypothetical protein
LPLVAAAKAFFHSASRHYTVKQVEEAFAAQGSRLREPARQEIPGVAVLRAGHRPNLIAALVKVSASRSTTFIYIAAPKGSGARHHRQGNVMVALSPSSTEPVKDALARLH